MAQMVRFLTCDRSLTVSIWHHRTSHRGRNVWTFRAESEYFRFRLKPGNDEFVTTSETFSSKASAQNGIDFVRTNAPDVPTEDLT